MTKNNKPVLSILIDEDKRTRFADLARRNSLSMGYLVNKAIDRMLEADSIDIYGDSTVTSVGSYVDSSAGGMSRSDIEELVKSSIASTDIERLIKSYVDSHSSSAGLTHQEVRDIAAATIKDSIAFERLCDEGAVIKVAENLVNAAFNPLSQAIAKLEAPGAISERIVMAEIKTLADLVKELEKDLKEYIDDRLSALTTLPKPLAIAPTIELLPPDECNFKRSDSTPYKTKNKQVESKLEPSQEPNELTFRQFCQQYGLDVLEGTSNQPPKPIVLEAISQVEAMGYIGWSWSSSRKRLIREI
jgi:hypothetical protein